MSLLSVSKHKPAHENKSVLTSAQTQDLVRTKALSKDKAYGYTTIHHKHIAPLIELRGCDLNILVNLGHNQLQEGFSTRKSDSNCNINTEWVENEN